MSTQTLSSDSHHHVFLGAGHERNERKTWIVILLCAIMMSAEIAGGALFGSLALVADGLHMSTHAGAMLIAALAYTYARRHADDPRYSFGTGKVGDLAGFTSAIVLAMIALLIGYEAVSRLFDPVPIQIAEAIPIAAVGLVVNIVSAWLLSGDHHGHQHGHGHGHGQALHPHHDAETKTVATRHGRAELSVYEEGVPPRFRLRFPDGSPPAVQVSLTTIRSGGSAQEFCFINNGDCLESMETIPEPHAFEARLRLPGEEHVLVFEEHDHGALSTHRDNSIRSAYVHVLADAAVSVLVIAGLLLAWAFGWLWMDPLAGLVGALVIANWSYTLMRDTAGILLDAVPDENLQARIRSSIEEQGDLVSDLHLWRLGPGHLGVVLSVISRETRTLDFYRNKLQGFPNLSHITIELVLQN